MKNMVKIGEGFHYGSRANFQLAIIDSRYNFENNYCNLDFCEYK